MQEVVLRSHTSAYFNYMFDVPSLELVTSPKPCADYNSQTQSIAPLAQLQPMLEAPAGASADPAVAPDPQGEGGLDGHESGVELVVQCQHAGAAYTGAMGAERLNLEAPQGADQPVAQDGLGQDQGQGSVGDLGLEARVGLDGVVQQELPVVMFPERAQAQVAAFLRTNKQQILDMVRALSGQR